AAAPRGLEPADELEEAGVVAQVAEGGVVRSLLHQRLVQGERLAQEIHGLAVRALPRDDAREVQRHVAARVGKLERVQERLRRLGLVPSWARHMARPRCAT